MHGLLWNLVWILGLLAGGAFFLWLSYSKYEKNRKVGTFVYGLFAAGAGFLVLGHLIDIVIKLFKG